ncbi:MAG: aminotransferase class I/II-fold pyridoxal phosphate-dependent enzyme [Bacteroidetes bacterium]|nr:aminotransferase class I/II-fold pyridoxal phosphate-dependent enzyme [Bacteroidota bacterium]
MSTKIWLSPPHMSGLEEKYVREAFDTNWIAPLGPNVDGFEQELSQYLDGTHIAVLGSGTAAIHLALVLLGVKPRDEVIAADFTFIATANPILYQGATPVFVDSEMQTWNMDPELLEEAIVDRMKKSKKPKAIIFVDVYGMSANIEALVRISLKYDIPLIEDSAESLGSKYNGRHCGTYGAMGILSFNGNKIITTSGGGALVSGDPDYARQARFLASQAKENTLHFEHSQLGYNYRMSNVLAGIGRGQLEVIEERVAAHRNNNQRYRELLSDIPGLIFQSEPDEKYFSNYWLTSIIIGEPDDRFNSQSVIQALGQDNIDSRPLMKPMHMQQVFKDHPAYLNGNSTYLFNNGLCLPSGSSLTDADIDRIVGGIRSVRGKR